MFGSLGITELFLIAFILLLLFGHKRLSGLGREMGSFIRNFRAGLHDDARPRELPPGRDDLDQPLDKSLDKPYGRDDNKE